MVTQNPDRQAIARGAARIDAKLSGMPDITGNIPVRVAQGAALLDTHRPGWVDEIDLGTLDLANPCRCILGQTWDEPVGPDDGDGAYYGHVTRLFGGLTTYHEEVAHGFNADDETEFPALTDEWRRVILARRAGPRPPTEDHRVTHAREVLAESQATTPGDSKTASPAHWWGRLENVVKTLLAVIDEQARS